MVKMPKRITQPMQARWLWSVLVGALAACGSETEPRTQLMLVVDTDVPGPNAIRFDIHGPDQRDERVESAFEGPEDLPRTLALVHTEGALGPFEVSASVSLPDGPTLSRTHVVSFVPGQTLLVPLHLASACGDALQCEGRTCDERGACADRELSAEQLLAYGGLPERVFEGGAATMDAGADAGSGAPDAGGDASSQDASTVDGGPTELRECSGQSVDILSDVAHCGRCGNACPAPSAKGNATGPVCRAGVCGVACEPGFNDCDGRANNGCEVQEDLFQTSREHCGGCNMPCRGAGRMCSGGQCSP